LKTSSLPPLIRGCAGSFRLARRILTRWEKRADTYLAMLHLACGLITWRTTEWEPLPE